MKRIKVQSSATEASKEYILKLLAGETTKGITHMAIGTGTPTATKLGNEKGRRTLLDVTGTGNERTFESLFEADYPDVDIDISEVGLIADASHDVGGSGTYIALTTLATVQTKRAGVDAIYITYKLKYV